jgi:hypothetical protein
MHYADAVGLPTVQATLQSLGIQPAQLLETCVANGTSLAKCVPSPCPTLSHPPMQKSLRLAGVAASGPDDKVCVRACVRGRCLAYPHAWPSVCLACLCGRVRVPGTGVRRALLRGLGAPRRGAFTPAASAVVLRRVCERGRLPLTTGRWWWFCRNHTDRQGQASQRGTMRHACVD